MEMCNELELRGIMLQEASDKYYDDAVKASKELLRKRRMLRRNPWVIA